MKLVVYHFIWPTNEYDFSIVFEDAPVFIIFGVWEFFGAVDNF